jgi:1,2-phenylacetyl-CoA epoxidase catalytic subunit
LATDVESLEQLEPEASRALVNVVTRLAACKDLLGRRYAEWCVGAPTLEAAAAAAAMAQDELGHGRVFLGVARGVQEVEAGEQEQDVRHAPAELQRPFGSWAEFVAAALTVDTALTLLLERMADSRFVPLRQRARKALQEERFHEMYARGWAGQLTVAGGPVAESFAAVRSRWLDAAEAWLAPLEGDLARLGELGLGGTPLGGALRARAVEDRAA